MDKQAFKAALKDLGKAIKEHPGAAGALGGAVLGGAAGGYSASKKNKKNQSFGKKLKRVAKGTARGALTGGIFGNLAATPWQIKVDINRDFSRKYRRPRSGSGEAGPARTKDPGTPSWLKGVKTKAEAKTKFREQAKVHHPDRGGSEETMKKVNSEWDAYQKHGFNKLSFVMSPFFEELRKIYRE